MPEGEDPRQGRRRLARFISNKWLFRLALVVLWESGRCALGWNLLLDRGQRRASGRKRKRGRRKEIVDSSPSAVSNPRAFNAENAGPDNEEQQEKISRLQDF